MQFQACLTHPVQVRHHDDAILHRNAEQRDEADAGGHIEMLARQMQGNQAAERCQRHDAQDEQRLAERVGADGEEDQHQAHDQSEDDQQPRFRTPLVLELAAPLQAHPAWIEMHPSGDLGLGFRKVAGQVPIAVVDADRQVALAVFPGHGALPHAFTHRCDLLQGHLRAGGRRHRQVADGGGTVARRLIEAHGQRIGALTHIYGGHGRLTDPGLDDILHVGHVEAVAGRLVVVQFDLDLRDRRLLEQ